ncbi:hypothetical protein [Clostridium manihotivorum]|nr:hypothetical protein [Clostridium manihotivorum]
MKYEEPVMEIIEDEEVCVDVHSSAFALAVVGAIVISVLWPPTSAS